MSQASSPCIKLCIIESVSGLCLGCGRSLDEIAQWGSLSEPERRAAMVELPRRLGALNSAAKPDAERVLIS